MGEEVWPEGRFVLNDQLLAYHVRHAKKPPAHGGEPRSYAEQMVAWYEAEHEHDPAEDEIIPPQAALDARRLRATMRHMPAEDGNAYSFLVLDYARRLAFAGGAPSDVPDPVAEQQQPGRARRHMPTPRPSSRARARARGFAGGQQVSERLDRAVEEGPPADLN